MKKRAGLLASVALMLMLTVLLSACAAGQGQTQTLTANEIVQKVREAVKNNQSVQGTIELSANLNKAGLKSLMAGMMPGAPKGDEVNGPTSHIDMLPDTASVTLKVWAESPDKARIEVASSSLPGISGATMVYDGKKVYAYDPTHNKVYTKTPGDKAEMPAGMAGMMGDWATLTPEQRGDKLIAASDIKLLGSEQVSNKDTYKLEITPKQGALEQLGLNAMVQMMAGSIVNDLKATVWVDKASFIPVRATLSHPQIGDFTYSSTVDLDKPIDPAQFVLQIPAGAETVDLDALREQMQPKSMTLPQARDEVAKDGWKLLEPSYLPASTTLVEVTRLPGMPAGGPGDQIASFHMTGSGVLTGGMPTTTMGQAGQPDTVIINSEQAQGFGTWFGMPPMVNVESGSGRLNSSGFITSSTMAPMSPSYMLKYSSPSADFTITESKSEIEKGLGDGFSGVKGNGSEMKEVTVRGVKAMAFSPDGSGWTSLMWQDNAGLWVNISGKLSVDETVKIADGLR